MPVTLRTEAVGAVFVAAVAGELDDHAADGLRAALDRELDKLALPRLVLDLGGITFMDSAGLGVILGRYRRIRERGGDMAIAAAPPAVGKLLAISGLHKLMRVYSRRQDAIRSFKEVSR